MSKQKQDEAENVAIDSHAIHLGSEQCAKITNYHTYLRELRKDGETLRSDKDQPKLLDKPYWFKEDLFRNAQSVYSRHLMGVNFAHLSGLLLLVRVDSIYRTLNSTGQSSTVARLFKRYYHTLKHVKSWYEGDIFDEQNEAYRSLLIVRGMHNKVSTKFNDKTSTLHQVEGKTRDKLDEFVEDVNGNSKIMVTNQIDDQLTKMVHISEFDIMLTQFAFVGFIVMNATNMGLLDDFNERDLDSILHFWRVIGYYLGASEKFNLCSYELDDVKGLCEAFKEVEYKQSLVKNALSDPPGIMSLNIIRSIKFIPLLTIYGMMRYLYELLGQETTEIDHKRNWYSNLSYTLINLVMTRLLIYKPLRSFNNGMIRLSIFLVGKIEGWFSDRLEKKYGQALKY